MPEAVSGMAATIRSAVESETFDLAGQTPATIEKTIADAFGEPLPLVEMIRITFVTGAGKLARQKYDDGAAKAVTATLRELGYEEDRGASAVLECAGTFKLQHDTGKNLKTVVVFPKVTGGGGNGADQAAESVGQLSVGGSFLPEKSPEHRIAYSSMNVFERMISSVCPSWSQKKGCVTAIESIKQDLAGLDEKLLNGTPLTDIEQDFYDSVSATSLDEKLACVKELMHKQVDEGRITGMERRALLDQVAERLEKLAKEIAAAEAAGKKKRVENLTANRAKAEERKQKLEKTAPKDPHPLKNEAEIGKLRRELGPLLEIEESAKGRLLTLKESQSVARKDEILEEIQELEEASRGWFESEEMFEARVRASRTSWEAKNKSSKKTARKPASSGGAWSSAKAPAVGSKWVTPATKKVGPAKPKGNKLPRGGGVFAAMMDDSDSDD